MDSSEVLILGNGASRSEHMDFVRSWEGEIWACNWAYFELIDGSLPRIDRLIGDKKALIRALKAKRKYGFTYECICKGEPKDELSECTPASSFGVSRKTVFDSGSALVELALREGYEKIYVVGFDLGGRDLYITDHDKRNKSAWVRKWRMLDQKYGLDRVEFIGTDHKWYIQSDLPPDYYARFYTKGFNHLVNVLLEDEKYHDDVIILENGASRLRYNQYIQHWDKEIWVLDRGFIEYNALPAIHRVGTIQPSTAIEAVEYKKKKGLAYAVYCRDFIKDYESEIHLFREKRGWLAGPLMVSQALQERYNNIYLIGFDLGKEDLYGKNTLKGRNYPNQLLTVQREFGNMFDNRVHLVDNEEALSNLFKQDTASGEKRRVRA